MSVITLGNFDKLGMRSPEAYARGGFISCRASGNGSPSFSVSVLYEGQSVAVLNENFPEYKIKYPGKYAIQVSSISGQSASIRAYLDNSSPQENPTRRVADLRVALFGDSTANPGATQSPASQDCTVLTAPHPGSGATVLVMPQDRFDLPYYYPRAFLVMCAGVSGETTTQALARDAASASSTRRATADVINYSPDVVIFRIGINDLISGVDASTVHSNRKALIERLTSSGSIVIDEGVFGYSGTAATSAQIRRNLLLVNEWAKEYAEANAGKVYFLNPIGMTCDNTGAYKNSVSRTDGIHPSSYGASIIAQAESNLLKEIFGTPVGPRFPGVNIITNALMANTGSQSYGTVATGFSITASNGTRQNATIETINGTRFQTCECLITGASSSLTITAPYDPTAMGIVSGDVYGIEFDYMFEGATKGSAPPLSTNMLGRLDTYQVTTNGRVVVDALSPAEYGKWPSAAGTMFGKCVLGPFQYQESSANLTVSSSLTLVYTTNVNDGSVFKVGMGQPRIVKIGQGSAGLGEIVTSSLASGSAVSLTNNTVASIASVSLGKGTWQISGAVDFVLASSSATQFSAGISTISTALSSTQDFTAQSLEVLTTSSLTKNLPTPVVYLTVFSTTTVYLVARSLFSAGTQTGYGSITAIRVAGKRPD